MRLTMTGLHGLAELQRIPEALRFERDARDPARAQQALLRRFAAENGDTAFGRHHGIGEIRDLKDLQRRVAVQTYADVQPWIARQMLGEARVLSAERPILFASSTGTTGAPKRTPTTPTFRRDFQRTVLVSMFQVAARFPAAFTGQVLYFVAPREIDRAPDGTPIGYTSGFNFSTMPRLVRTVYAWPYEVFCVQDHAAQTYLLAWLAAMSPVTMVAGIFPHALLDLLRAIEGFAEPLVRDLRRGKLRDDIRLTESERRFFERLARTDERAASRIEHAARGAGGKLPASAALPHLRLVYCWTGASAAYYIPELKRRLGPQVAVRDAIYAANEAWGNVTFGEDELGGPVAITSHVFEFVREADWERGVRDGVLADELVVGERYRLVVTTSAGLYRYDLADIVECTGYYHGTARIRFSHRAGASLSLVGEKLNEAHVTHAVSRVLSEVGIDAAFFTAVPRFLPTPRWQVALELRSVVSDSALEALRIKIDQALGVAASDYEDLRKSELDPLALMILEPGEHERNRRALVEKGRQDAQLKVVHLMTDPDALASYRVRSWIEAKG